MASFHHFALLLTLLLFASLGHSQLIITGALGSCNCTANSTNLNCENVGLVSNSISFLSQSLASACPALVVVNMRRNSLNRVPSLFFAGLTKLRSVDLCCNNFTTLHVSLFQDLPVLEQVVLNQNPYLRSLPSKLFSGSRKMLGIQIASCPALASLPVDIFAGLTSLLQIAIDQNTLLPQPHSAYLFTGLTSLSTILCTGRVVCPSSSTFDCVNLSNSALTVRAVVACGSVVNITGSGGSCSCNKTSTRLECSSVGLRNTSLVNSLQLPSLSAVCPNLTEVLIRGNPDLDSIPAGLFSGLVKLRLLDLSENGLTMLPNGSFTGLTALTYLILSTNTLLTNLPPDAFNGLTALEELSVSNTGLQSLADGQFNDLTALTSLLLDDNAGLTIITANLFSSLTSLLTLSLNGLTGLQTVPETLFSNLASLKVLSLCCSSSLTIPVTMFATLTKLTQVTMNNISTNPLPANLFFGLTNLKNLYCSGSVICPSALEIMCGSNGDALDDEAMTLLSSCSQEVGLTGQTGPPTTSTCSCGKDSTALYCDSIGLNDASIASLFRPLSAACPNLIEISIQLNPDFSTFPATFFQGLLKLETLNISRNVGLRTLPSVLFLGLTTLTTLDLGQNGALASIPLTLFSSLTALRTLNMFGTPAPLSANLFAGLYPSLSALSCLGSVVCSSSSSSATYPCSNDGTPMTMESLSAVFACAEIIIYGSNPMSEGCSCGLQTATLQCNNRFINDSSLRSLAQPLSLTCPNLTTISLEVNSLKSIPDAFFTGLKKLRDVILYGNTELTSLPAGLFTGLTTLNNIALYNTGITSLAATQFAGLSALRTLNMHTMPALSAFAPTLFSDLTALEYLFIHGNTAITSIPPGLLSSLTALTTLQMDTLPKLTSLPANLFSRLTRLQQLYIANSPLLGNQLPAGVLAGLTSLALFQCTGSVVCPSSKTYSCSTPESVYLVHPNLTAVLRCAKDFGVVGQAGVCSCGIDSEILDCSNKGINSTGLSSSVVYQSLSAACPNLTAIYMTNNPDLTGFPVAFLAGLTKLQTLFLQSTGLTSLAPDTFYGLSALQEVNLRSNTVLTSLHAALFANLSMLTRLDICCNEALTSLPTGVFAGLTRLEQLKMHTNPLLSSIPSDAFAGLVALQELSVFSNPLLPSPLAASFIGGLSNLTVLRCSGSVFCPLISQSIPCGVPADSAMLPADLDTVKACTTNGMPVALSGPGGYCYCSASSVRLSCSAVGINATSLSSLSRSLATACPNLVEVQMGNNPDLTVYPSTFFSGLTKLQILGLESTGVLAFPTKFFSGLTALEQLKLHSNTRLTSLSATLFAGLTSLMSLDLCCNPALDTLPTTLFAGLNRLSELFIHNNPNFSKPLSANLFVGLSNLTRLVCSGMVMCPLSTALHSCNSGGNDMTAGNLSAVLACSSASVVLTGTTGSCSCSATELVCSGKGIVNLPEVLSGCDSIVSMDLSNNAISTIPTSFFNSTRNITSLRLDGNRISTLDLSPLRFLSSLLSLILDNNQLSLVYIHAVGQLSPLRSLRTLSLRRNVLRNVTFRALTNNPQIDLSSNLITSVDSAHFIETNLTSLNLANNTITRVEFRTLTFLEILNLSSNPLGSYLELQFMPSLRQVMFENTTPTFAVFGALPTSMNLTINSRTLNTVQFSEGSLPGNINLDNNAITSISIGSVSGPRTLSLNNNRLSSFGGTGRLTNVRTLTMTNNRFTDLAFANGTFLPNLVYLDVSSNPISSFPNVLQPLFLETLIMANLSITQLVLGNFPRLTTLDASNNSLSLATLANMTQLTFVDLSRNRLSGFTLRNMSQLETLSLKRNLITTVDSQTFAGLSNLKSLNLANNLLTNISPAMFRNLTFLEELSVRDNSVSTILPDSFSGMTRLLILDIASVPLLNIQQSLFADLNSSLLIRCLAPQIVECATNTTVNQRCPNNERDGMRLYELGICPPPVVPCSCNATSTKLICDSVGLDNTTILNLPLPLSTFCPNLASIIVAGNPNLDSLPADFFFGLGRLRSVNIDNNVGLLNLSPVLFLGLTTLSNLSISSNTQLTSLPVNVFTGLTALYQLALSNNTALTNLPADLFAGLMSLRRIALNDNTGLTSIPASLFSELSLNTLDLHGNTGLSGLPSGLFSFQAELTELFLDGISPHMGILSARLFLGLTSLTVLHCAGAVVCPSSVSHPCGVPMSSETLLAVKTCASEVDTVTTTTTTTTNPIPTTTTTTTVFDSALGDARIETDSEGNLLIDVVPGKTVFFNGINMTALVERLTLLEENLNSRINNSE